MEGPSYYPVDDVWTAILAQFNIYVNAHAEKLHHLFVDHEGQKKLEIIGLKDITGNAHLGVDYGKFSFKMAQMIADNIKDPSFREWILPQFTTTTKTDQAAASIIMMSTLQQYFSYGLRMLCGLPSVTLLGQKGDWEKIALKAERLASFGEECEAWYRLLKGVLKRFVESLNTPESEETKDFWQKIAHYFGGGSGRGYLSGWITAFCYWGATGKAFFIQGKNPSNGTEMHSLDYDDDDDDPTPILQLDEARYHCVDTNKIPPGWASVPVKLDNNGNIIECIMVAGSVGTKYSSSGKPLK